MAVQTVLNPSGERERENNVNSVCYKQGTVDQSDKNSGHHTFETNGHHCDLIIFPLRTEPTV
jgi:hypothetical protein